jgi:hypothetical protein
MTVPASLEEARAAARGIHSMTDVEFRRRKTSEAGDPLVAFFVLLAQNLFPEDTEPQTSVRVELMLAAYFLRGDLAQKKGKPPPEAAAKAAVQKVASLGGAALNERITDEIGDPVLAFFGAFAKKLINEPDDERGRTVQLMVLAFLAGRELAA